MKKQIKVLNINKLDMIEQIGSLKIHSSEHMRKNYFGLLQKLKAEAKKLQN